MLCRGREIRIARALRSPNITDRHRAIGEFVRLFTFSAPTDLAIQATAYPEVCSSYSGEQPLAEYLLNTLPLPREVSLAWGIALLEGDALLDALSAFAALLDDAARRLLGGFCRSPEDVCQDHLLQLLANRGFRRTCFGKYSGQGSLLSYLRTALIREAARRSRGLYYEERASEVLNNLSQRSEDAPEVLAARKELRLQIADVLREILADPGLVPFLLQNGLGMSPADTGRVLGLGENAVRQRVFRFRRRFKSVWQSKYPRNPCPFTNLAG